MLPCRIGKRKRTQLSVKKGVHTTLSHATPNSKALEAIQKFEKETGKTVLAFDLWEPADLNEAELKKLQALEKETCHTMIAIKANH